MTADDQKHEAYPPARLAPDLPGNTAGPVTTEALQKSCSMFESLFEHAPDAVIVVDNRGTIRKSNEQAERLFGYRRDEMIGNLIEMLIPEQYHDIHRHHREGYFADPRLRQMGAGLELYGRHQHGAEIPVDIMLSPIATEEGTWALAVIRNITSRKQAAAEISALNAELKKQLDQLAEANRELEAFSYSVSHDLRAPLRHIVGFIELLNGRDTTDLDEKSRHYLQVIAEAAGKMGELIDDLLAFSRMSRTDMTTSRIDLGALVNQVVNELTSETAGRTVVWQIWPLPEVIGDRAMLRLVLANLIGNALKFTRTRSEAHIEIGAMTADPEEIQVFVRDNGVGFNMEYVGKLFGLFQRLHSTSQFEGTGVGLANVQRIIRRHGGKVWAEATMDGGATFWFTLPKRREEQ